MKNNLLVWTSHSCRPDVFEEELSAGNLPNYSSIVERGTYFPKAVVGGHFQRTSNLSEITGRPFTSEVHPRENLLNAAAESGAHVGVVNDFIITQGARFLVAKAKIELIDEVYPNLIERPPLPNLGTPKLEFLPDLSPERWLYWYRERATHRHFYNFALAFEEEGGLLVEVASENPAFRKGSAALFAPPPGPLVRRHTAPPRAERRSGRHDHRRLQLTRDVDRLVVALDETDHAGQRRPRRFQLPSERQRFVHRHRRPWHQRGTS